MWGLGAPFFLGGSVPSEGGTMLKKTEKEEEWERYAVLLIKIYIGWMITWLVGGCGAPILLPFIFPNLSLHTLAIHMSYVWGVIQSIITITMIIIAEKKIFKEGDN